MQDAWKEILVPGWRSDPTYPTQHPHHLHLASTKTAFYHPPRKVYRDEQWQQGSVIVELLFFDPSIIVHVVMHCLQRSNQQQGHATHHQSIGPTLLLKVSLALRISPGLPAFPIPIATRVSKSPLCQSSFWASILRDGKEARGRKH